MLSQMSTSQFAEWRASAAIDPFTPERLDLLIAHLIWQFAAIIWGKDLGVPIETFLLQYGVDVDATEEIKKALEKQESGRQKIAEGFRHLMTLYGGKTVKAEQ